jgi:hypothetical protein
MVPRFAAAAALSDVAAASDEFADEAADLLAGLGDGPPPPAVVDRLRFFTARLATRPGVDQAHMVDLYRYFTRSA